VKRAFDLAVSAEAPRLGSSIQPDPYFAL
jgi:hypothetical protein